MKRIPFLALVFVCVSCSVSRKTSFNPARKYSPQQLQQDFSLLQQILKTNHPSLYWYSTPDSVNGYFLATQTSLQDSLTEQQFKNKISWTISKIHCGHTTVRSSKKYSAFYSKKRLPQFPLSIKVWNDTAVVVANLSRADAAADNDLVNGTIVTGINGYSSKQILDSLCQLIGTDGYSDNFKYQLISFNFPAYYRNAFGSDSVYTVTYLDSLGTKKESKLKSFEPKTDSFARKQGPAPRQFEAKQLRKLKLLDQRNMQIDTALNTAFLSVNTFSGGKLNSFFRRSFKSIIKQNVKNLVIDLRLNSGGSVLASTRLAQYLVINPFHVADTVAAFSRHFPYKRQIRPWFIYWLSMHISGKNYTDDRIHFRYFENHYFKPMSLT
jgi:hypothetical protein